MKKFSAKKFSAYLNITDAAALIGVTTNTLRNWEASGKLMPYRHPMNNYRLYDKEELESLLGEITKDIPVGE